MVDKNDWIQENGSPMESTLHDFDENKELQGIYVSKKDNVGSNGSTMYYIEKDGETFSMWGSMVLDDRFSKINIGEEVKVVFTGKNKSLKTGKYYRTFDVFHRAAK